MSAIIETLSRVTALGLTEQIKADITSAWGNLLKAHDGRAWEALGYDSWNSYVKTEFQMSKQHSFRMLDFARVRAVLTEESPMGDSVIVPSYERQTRPLKALPAEQQPAAWQAAVEDAGGKQPTAKQVEAAVERVTEATTTKTERITFTPSYGLQYATMAITELDKIHRKDTERESALKKVLKYINQRLTNEQ